MQETHVVVGQPAARQHRGPSRLVAALAALVAVGLVVTYFLWWTKPTAFLGVGNGFSQRQTVTELHPITLDMVQRPVEADSETITVLGASPRVVTNTADAVIEFTVCHQSGGTPFAVADGVAADSCETVSPVTGHRVRLSRDGTATIAMTVTPRREGRVVVRGMDIDYSRGPAHLWQRGSQSTGPILKLKVTG